MRSNEKKFGDYKKKDILYSRKNLLLQKQRG